MQNNNANRGKICGLMTVTSVNRSLPARQNKRADWSISIECILVDPIGGFFLLRNFQQKLDICYFAYSSFAYFLFRLFHIRLFSDCL
jgi:hypothetical protein